MATLITIPFQRKNLSETISNTVLLALGLGCFFAGMAGTLFLTLLGIIFLGWGLFAFSKSKGVQVEPGVQCVWSYTSRVGIKQRIKHSLKDIESIQVTTGTQVHGGSNGVSVSNSTSFMVYKLNLLPSVYSKSPKVYLGDFFTKEECMLAAEQLSKATGLPLVLKIR